MIHLFLAAALSTAPSPAPTPLRTIVNERISDLCTALHENIAHSVEGLLANDRSIAASEPIFVAMAHDVESPSITDQTGLGNLHAPATIDHNSAAMQLDTQRIENIIGAIIRNLQVVDAQLSGLSRFAKDPKRGGNGKLLEMREQLEAVRAQQQQTLGVLEGIVDTRNMEAIAGRGDDVVSLFGLNEGNNPKISGTNQQFTTGVLSATVNELMDPSLQPSDFSTLQHSVYGRFYRMVYWEQGAIRSLESPLGKNIAEATKICAAR